MPIAAAADTFAVDLIEELRLRRWARENYCYAQARQASWHPLIHDEMRRIDEDVLEGDLSSILCEDESDESLGDSTILTDEALETADVSPIEEAAAIRRLVPLAPDLSGLHGPHEINPPHTRIGAPADKAEMHYT